MTIYEKISKVKDFDKLEEIRKSLNEACDKRHSELSDYKVASELSNGSFGFIKETFENLSPMLFETSEGKKIMSKYAKTIKENKNLSSLHYLFENIRKADNKTDVNFFINEIASNNWGIDKKTVNADIKRLGKLLAEAYLLLGKKCNDLIPTENTELSNAVQYIAENKKSGKNISEYGDAVKIIRESIESKESVEGKKKFADIDRIAENMISKFNEKFSEHLTEEEKNVVKKLCEGTSDDNKKEIFETYKKKCEDKLDEAKEGFEKDNDTESIDRIIKIKEQIGKKEFSKENIHEDICNMLEMIKVLE